MKRPPVSASAAVAATAVTVLATVIFWRYILQALAGLLAARVLWAKASRHFGIRKRRRPKSSWAALIEAWSFAAFAAGGWLRPARPKNLKREVVALPADDPDRYGAIAEKVREQLATSRGDG